MAREPFETFEDQAAAVCRVVKNSRALGRGVHLISKADEKHLECAAHNLNALGAFRQKLVDLAKNGALDEEADAVAEEVLKLLHIPVTE